MGSEGEMALGQGPLLVNTCKSRRGPRTRSGERAEEEEPLSPMARLLHEPRFDCCILAMVGSGKRINVEVVKAGLEATLARHPRLSSIPVRSF